VKQNIAELKYDQKRVLFKREILVKSIICVEKKLSMKIPGKESLVK
jgi:hypothetical protein